MKPQKKGPSPEQIIAEQKRQAEKQKQKAATLIATHEHGGHVVPVRQPALAVPDTRTSVQRYIDEIAPASIVGRLIKFSKEGKFVTADDKEPVNETANFIALCDEVLAGFIKFSNQPDVPPERIQGLIYDGFVLPERETLGDMDETQWSLGLSGKPEDPWKHQNCLPLQHIDTRELFTFATTSETGRRAVGKLLRHYDRMQRTNSGEVPVVRLRPSGFNHRDPRVGWVPTPSFQIISRVPRDSASKPDIITDMNDQIPY